MESYILSKIERMVETSPTALTLHFSSLLHNLPPYQVTIGETLLANRNIDNIPIIYTFLGFIIIVCTMDLDKHTMIGIQHHNTK